MEERNQQQQLYPLHDAVRSNDVALVQRILKVENEGRKTISTLFCSVLQKDGNGDLPIHIACRPARASIEIFRLLLEYDTEHKSVWERDGGRLLPIHRIFNHREETDPPLEVIRLLLEHDVRTTTPRGFAMPPVISPVDGKLIYKYGTLLLRGGFGGWLPIHYAVNYRVEIEVLQLLLKSDPLIGKASILTRTYFRKLPIHQVFDLAHDPVGYGSKTKLLETIKLLLELDTDHSTILARWENYFHRGLKYGGLPLHRACLLYACYGIDGVIELLLEKDKDKVSIHFQDENKHYPIMNALRYELPAHIIKLLFEHDDRASEKLREKNNEGDLPIHCALKYIHPSCEIIEMLIDKDYYKHSLETENSKGQLPLHVACLNDCPIDVMKSLVSHSTFHGCGPLLHRDNESKLPIHLIDDKTSDAYKLLRDELIREKKFRVHDLDLAFWKYQILSEDTSPPLQNLDDDGAEQHNGIAIAKYKKVCLYKRGTKDIIMYILSIFGEDEFGLF